MWRDQDQVTKIIEASSWLTQTIKERGVEIAQKTDIAIWPGVDLGVTPSGDITGPSLHSAHKHEHRILHSAVPTDFRHFVLACHPDPSSAARHDERSIMEFFSDLIPWWWDAARKSSWSSSAVLTRGDWE